MRKTAPDQKTGVLISFLVFFILLTCTAHAAPNGTETIISTGTEYSNQYCPSVNGDLIAWEDERTPFTNVYLYNLASGEEYAPVPGYDYWQSGPDIDGSRVVWGQLDTTIDSFSIVLYDSSTKNSESLPAVAGPDYWSTREDHPLPVISGDLVVWQDFTSGDWDIFSYDISSGTLTPVALISNPDHQKNPAVSGNYIAYENWSGTMSSAVWLYNISDSSAEEISPGSILAINPDISGDTVVWEDSGIVYRYTISTGTVTQVTPAGPGTAQMHPAISSDLIVLEDYRRSSYGDIYMYTISSGTETWVSPQPESAAQTRPAVSDSRIVWQDGRSGIADIFLLTLGSPGTCPVADFSPSVNAGTSPLYVVFTDRSAGSPILHRSWNYSNGFSSYPLDPGGETFSGTGIYNTRLTVGNLRCRNATPPAARYDIYVDTPPDAEFTATPRAGFAPLSVQFTDTSGGDPVTWLWDFGDGAVSHQQNPVHTYTDEGQEYTVSLTVNNTFAGMADDTETKTSFIRTYLGATGTATLPVQGISVVSRHGGWFLIYNATRLPEMIQPNPDVLTAFRPGSAGWENITFIAPDSAGFADTHGNNSYMGNLSQIIFLTEDITASGTSPSIGTGWGVNCRFASNRYPSSGSVSTQIWESTIPADATRFGRIIDGSNYIDAGGIAYTARIVKSGIGVNGNVTINMSLDRSWLGGQEPNTFIIGFGTNSQGDVAGMVIPAAYLFNDGTLDYFEAEVPEYFTTFGIAPLSGSGNPLQLITLSVTSHVSQPAPAEPYNPVSESDAGLPAAGVPPAMTIAAVPTPSPTATLETKVTADPGASAKVYTNAQGVVTQETRLTSSDGRATITIGEGIVAKDAAGKPLESITIRVLSMADLPPVPSDPVFVFDGIAYEIGPDGATFSPPVSLSLSPVEARWGRDYWIKTFDRKSGTWQDLPTTFDGSTGIVMAPASHFSIHALFTSASTPPPTIPKTTVPPTVMPQQVKAQPPTTAVSIFMNMMGWIAGIALQNLLIIMAVTALAIAGFFVMRGRRPKWE